MVDLDKRGQISLLIIPVVLFFITTMIFGYLAYDNYAKYKDAQENVDQKSQQAVAAEKSKLYHEIEAEFVEKEKLPYLTYQSSPVLSSVKFDYPKTWSSMIAENESASKQIDATFNPTVVRTDNPSERSYAFRFQLDSRIYSNALRIYESKVKKGDLRARSVVVSHVKGVRLDGQINKDDKGSIVLLPIRDKTLILWTESDDFVNDFNKIIETLSFTP